MTAEEVQELKDKADRMWRDEVMPLVRALETRRSEWCRAQVAAIEANAELTRAEKILRKE